MRFVVEMVAIAGGTKNGGKNWDSTKGKTTKLRTSLSGGWDASAHARCGGECVIGEMTALYTNLRRTGRTYPQSLPEDYILDDIIGVSDGEDFGNREAIAVASEPRYVVFGILPYTKQYLTRAKDAMSPIESGSSWAAMAETSFVGESRKFPDDPKVGKTALPRKMKRVVREKIHIKISKTISP